MANQSYIIEVSGPLRKRYMTIRAESERFARIVASRKIWPARGEYIASILLKEKEPA